MTQISLKIVCAIALFIGSLMSMGQPVKSVIGAKKTLSMSGASAKDYIQDGLFFIGENIAPPSSGFQSIYLGKDLALTNGWTVELCGECLATVRNEIMFGPTTSKYSLNPWATGWWLASNNTSINFRFGSNERSTGQTNADATQLAYTCAGWEPVAIKSFALGALVGEYSVSSFNLSVASYLNSGSTAYWNIYSLRVYNRPLSAEEISHNDEVDKERFGLQ